MNAAKAKAIVSLVPSSIALRVLLGLFDRGVIGESDLSFALAAHEAHHWAPKLGLA